MKSYLKFQTLNFKFRLYDLKIGSVFFLLFLSFSCSVPNLEKPECIASRATVKQFYSNHFGGDFKPNAANLEKSKNYLTANLLEELKNKNENQQDYFTQTADYPKAFRVGGCEVISNDKTIFEILIFWKDEVRTEQREIKVETVNENGKWLIAKVENKN